MDMQGTPLGNSGTGSKVTTDPASNDAIPEKTGIVDSDSLAAESANSNGAFSMNITAPQQSSGTRSSLNNTDTSGATILEPAPKKSARDDALKGSEGTVGLKYSEGAQGQGDPNTAKKGMVSGSSGFDEATSNNDQVQKERSQKEIQDRISDESRNKRVSEEGFDSNAKNNASFNSDIGSDNDPSRQAIADLQKKAQSASGGTGPRQPVEGRGTGPYDALNSEDQA